MIRRCPIVIAMVAGAVLCGCGDRLILQTNTFRVSDLSTVQRVAVVDFAGNRGQAIADLVTVNLLRAGYDVVERDRLRDIVRERMMGEEGFMDLSDAEKAKVFGKILNADAIITGEVVRQVPPFYQKEDDEHLIYESATLELAARAFDARTGKVFWTAVINGTATAKNGKHLKVMDYINEPCWELVYSFKKADYQDVAKVYEGDEIDKRRSERGFGF